MGGWASRTSLKTSPGLPACWGCRPDGRRRGLRTAGAAPGCPYIYDDSDLSAGKKAVHEVWVGTTGMGKTFALNCFLSHSLAHYGIPFDLLEPLGHGRLLGGRLPHRSLLALGPPLVKALEDEDAGVRWLAAEALVALGEAGLPPLLEALTRRANSYWLREGAHHVLRNYSHMNGSLANVLAALNNLEPDLEVPWAADAALRALSKRARKRIKIRAPHH